MTLPRGIKRHRTMSARRNKFFPDTYDHNTDEGKFNALWLKLRKENNLPDYEYFMELKNEDIRQALAELNEYANE